ncbi:BatD family protein [Methylococcus sp. EFPC2]|uniref:BatD family protein n=1 Tax=Methylococcus sp. EFPC2 TaxID=2812648 RepID=UPI0019677141|nr:BatD family protein [Methylococcus sp. EFPC2]QSA96760.1 protein BatD [Methylococcus sp. EFPC2]
MSFSLATSIRWLGCLLFLVATPALAATVQVTLDSRTVRLGESFNVVFGAEASPDGEPDFAPLKQDFDIVSQSQSSQVSIVNGRFHRKTEWLLTLIARRAGSLTLPPVSFGRDASPATPILVEEGPDPSTKNGAPSGDLIVEAEAEPRSPYVQAQVVYTLRVFFRVDVAGADLSEPAPADTLIERLGKERRYTAQRGGLDYTVVERKYALFPQKSGPLHIDPVRLEARVADGGRSRFNSLFNRATRVLRLNSNPLDLTVRAVPSAVAGKPWLPAESVQLEETWSQDPGRLKVGEPVTRTLSLRAVGATVGVLPEIAAMPETVADLRQYPDQPSLNEEKKDSGVVAAREEKVALIPGRAGRIVLPAIEIPWWNIRTDQPEVARIPQRILTIESAQGLADDGQQAAVSTPKPMTTGPAQPAAAPAVTPPDSAEPGSRWLGLALLCATGWAITAAGWWGSRYKKGRKDDKGLPRPRSSSSDDSARSVRRELQAACRANDARAARVALLRWARIRYPAKEPLTLTVWCELGAEFAEAVDRLERALYGRVETPWSGDELWGRFAGLEEVAGHRDVASPGAVLPPLYTRTQSSERSP